jgi:hypothetical protein
LSAGPYTEESAVKAARSLNDMILDKRIPMTVIKRTQKQGELKAPLASVVQKYYIGCGDVC